MADNLEEIDVDVDEGNSEISGDCNESQPCRRDEALLPQCFFEMVGMSVTWPGPQRDRHFLSLDN